MSSCMRTTLNIDPELLARAQQLSGARTKTETVELGLRALVAREAARRLARLAGSEPALEAPPRRRGPERE
jgi:Arc/MetJ family transcription regulator